jgi:hypothetical protein
LRRIWEKIPEDTDILITHGPPLGIYLYEKEIEKFYYLFILILGFGDQVADDYHVGCFDLLDIVRNKVKPKYHIFGHSKNFIIY